MSVGRAFHRAPRQVVRSPADFFGSYKVDAVIP
jgi:hypothetical protein